MVTGTNSGSGWRKPSISIFSGDRLSLLLAGVVAVLFVCAFFSFSSLGSIPIFSGSKSADVCNCNSDNPPRLNLQYDPPVATFYDDPKYGYTIDNPIKDWDDKRREWLRLHPSFYSGSDERLLLVTGSQSTPCKNPIGDHFLLRFYRNKVDYCRIHGYDIFYNNVLLHPEMVGWWAKLPAIRAAMLAHPEAEWIWWIDQDTVFTDMDYKVPLHRYENRNFIVHGWPDDVYKNKSWVGLNSGSCLIRNCQWSLDFLEKWADMGPQSPNYEKWCKILLEIFKFESNDQVALAYLFIEEQDRNRNETYIDSSYFLEGFWMDIMDKLENITERYVEIEKGVRMLRRRHAEKVSERYAVVWEEYLKDFGFWSGERRRRPFVTHFNGCQPCSGKHNPLFVGCWEAINKALNFADNQVLRNYGFVHPNLSDSSTVTPLPFDYPALM